MYEKIGYNRNEINMATILTNLKISGYNPNELNMFLVAATNNRLFGIRSELCIWVCKQQQEELLDLFCLYLLLHDLSHFEPIQHYN